MTDTQRTVQDFEELVKIIRAIPEDELDDYRDVLHEVKKAIIDRVVMPWPRQPRGYA